MPTYEYACRECGEHLEVVQSFRDEPLATCPACGGALRKVFGAIGIAFKGSGFYRTDSRDSSGAAKPRAESKDKAASAGEKSTDGSKSGDSAGAGTGGSSESSGSSGKGSAASSSSTDSGSAAGKGDSRAAASS